MLNWTYLYLKAGELQQAIVNYSRAVVLARLFFLSSLVSSLGNKHNHNRQTSSQGRECSRISSCQQSGFCLLRLLHPVVGVVSWSNLLKSKTLRAGTRAKILRQRTPTELRAFSVLLAPNLPSLTYTWRSKTGEIAAFRNWTHRSWYHSGIRNKICSNYWRERPSAWYRQAQKIMWDIIDFLQ